MNIYNQYSTKIKILVDEKKEILKLKNLNEFKGITVENPPPDFNFELSCNIALILGKLNKINPKDLAFQIKKLILEKFDDIESVELAGPGFLNIKLKNRTLKKITTEIIIEKNFYGSSKNNKSYNIEFVSANPTGPLHVGHCRGAIYGDVLSNLLIFNGNNVIKEYYVNDYGNQIINFTKSVYLRIREILNNENFVNEPDLYPGEYIIDIAKNIIKDNPDNRFENFDKSYELLKKQALSYSMSLITSDLKQLGIKHDIFFSETEIVNKKLVEKAISLLKKNNLVVEGYLQPPKGEETKNWKNTKKLIFKSTLFGDDADRALKKNDNSWTYFANDLAYHLDKVSRKYDYLINVLGADHTGYIKRITAAVKALSNDKVKLNCKVCQLVKLYKDGKPFKMSKRAGDFISAQDLLNEVSRDSIRFMMLSRSNDVELEFDFDKVLEKSKDNPVFYVQYCYARICSLFRSLNLSIDGEDNIQDVNYDLDIYQTKILRKIFEWPKIIETASKKHEPHRIPFYLYDLSTLFHSYWSKGNENPKYKFIKDGKINNENTLIILKLLSLVLKNGMRILDVSLPSKM